LGIFCGVAAAYDRPGMILHERAGRFFSRRATRMIPMNDAASEVRTQVSEVEWDLRVDLAACYRLVALCGWDDLIFTHISARCRGQTTIF
jgi:hypothetical protein